MVSKSSGHVALAHAPFALGLLEANFEKVRKNSYLLIDKIWVVKPLAVGLVHLGVH